jgi:hypothetical protein
MKAFGLSLILLSTCAITTLAAQRASYEDATVVARSELIVVGHLKDNSIQNIPHGNWSENHAILVISEVIKGKSTNQEIPIIIHYSVDVVLGRDARDNEFEMFGGARKDYPTNLVRLFEKQGSQELFGERPVVEDASKDYIWFLRRGSGIYGEIPDTNDLGVMSGQDMQPLKMKEYFELFLTKDPETAVKAYAADHPEVAARAQSWLNHLEIQRIVKIEDPAKRLESLLPHYLNDSAQWPEIRQGIVSCGKVAGEKLVPVFQDPNYKDRRMQIISIWRNMNYKEAASVLISLLEEDARFWAEQNVIDGWRNEGIGAELAQKRQTVSGEVYYSVAALRTLRDPRSKPVIELTKQCWGSIKIDPRIVEECDGALKALAEVK